MSEQSRGDNLADKVEDVREEEQKIKEHEEAERGPQGSGDPLGGDGKPDAEDMPTPPINAGRMSTG